MLVLLVIIVVVAWMLAMTVLWLATRTHRGTSLSKADYHKLLNHP